MMEQIDPEILAQNPTVLNEQQIQMLNTFKNEWPEEDFAQIKKLIVQILAKQLDEEWTRLEKERGWTQETYDQWGKEHMRTPYRNSL